MLLKMFGPGLNVNNAEAIKKGRKNVGEGISLFKKTMRLLKIFQDVLLCLCLGFVRK